MNLLNVKAITKIKTRIIKLVMIIDCKQAYRTITLKEVTNMFHCNKVEDIKRLGYKIRVYHNRLKNKDGSTSSRGGSTTVEITDNHGHTAIGNSKCHEKDNFVKRIGVMIAIGRALKAEESFVNA